MKSCNISFAFMLQGYRSDWSLHKTTYRLVETRLLYRLCRYLGFSLSPSKNFKKSVGKLVSCAFMNNSEWPEI